MNHWRYGSNTARRLDPEPPTEKDTRVEASKEPTLRLARLFDLTERLSKSERRMVEARIHPAPELRDENSISGSSDAAAVVDEKGSIIWVSDTLAAMFGYGPSGIVGQKLPIILPDVVPNDDLVFHTGDRVSTGIAPRVIEGSGLAADGTMMPVTVTVAPWSLCNNRFAGVIVRRR
jgi:PAS domain S-box-containing protein